ncbi:hypothetical protein FHL15_003201 [Xylaria flabelliformis]|uniref:Carbohydrate kinase PfkB domain-containing protein n=1 Tax=Xylaria flabelliformis TaxID=2512241 RepID=A0A553I782_9PEZI|nr:hypothetical protein FHL15_003201 [Xylaria flabelliformis]
MGHKFSRFWARKFKRRLREVEDDPAEVEGNQADVKDNQAGAENDQPEVGAGPSNAGDREIDIRGRGKEDDIEYPGKPKQSELGGEGLWATFGARLFKPRKQSQNIGCIVVTRYDYPVKLFDTLGLWNVAIATRHYYNLPINRVHIRYENQDRLQRTVSHQDPPYAPVVRNLRGNSLLTARVFHLSCVPCVVIRQLRYLIEYRKRIGIHPPNVVWQPVHVRAAPEDPGDKEEASFKETLESYLAVLPLVGVFCLSYQELGDIVGGVGYPIASEEQDVRKSVETLAETFPRSGIGIVGDGVLIVCCEPFGYYYRQGKDQGWVKAYSQYSNRKTIVDFTGGGSAFLGAFTVALRDGINLRDSCLRGAVAASFAMEQFGLPIVS